MKMARKAKTSSKMTDFFTLKNQQPKKEASEILSDGVIKAPSLKLSNWNINGLRSITSKGYLQNYLKQSDPDIFCLNELKITEQKFNQEKLSTFFDKEKYPFQFFNFCKPPIEGYSGVAIISKYSPIKVIYDLGDQEKHNQEGRLLTLEFEFFYLVASYVPNAGQNLDRLDYRTQEWDVDVRNYLYALKKEKKVIFTGDLNCAHEEIDLKNPKTNTKSAGFTKEERAGKYTNLEFTKLLESGFIDIFRCRNPKEQKFTFWSYRGGARQKNVGWRLDYFLLSENINLESIESIELKNDVMGSDHCPVELQIDMNKL